MILLIDPKIVGTTTLIMGLLFFYLFCKSIMKKEASLIYDFGKIERRFRLEDKPKSYYFALLVNFSTALLLLYAAFKALWQ